MLEQGLAQRPRPKGRNTQGVSAATDNQRDNPDLTDEARFKRLLRVNVIEDTRRSLAGGVPHMMRDAGRTRSGATHNKASSRIAGYGRLSLGRRRR